MWDSKAVLEIDVKAPNMPKIARSFNVDKDPEGLAFLDGRWMVVGNDLGDTLSIIDRVSGNVTSIPVEASTSKHGVEPTSLAYDETSKRLYATQAGLNAISAYDGALPKAPPAVAPAGRLPSQWWPSGTALLADGSLVVTSLMARGIGPKMPMQQYELLKGGIQRIPAPSGADLI